MLIPNFQVPTSNFPQFCLENVISITTTVVIDDNYNDRNNRWSIPHALVGIINVVEIDYFLLIGRSDTTLWNSK
jgi:hypothetical protein